jgi:fucose 4-O-acetylase-like acetyltransferase
MSSIGRVKLVDAVKGMAIVLVVYGHVAQGANHRGWWGSPFYFFQERFIYSFHMAAFFFVAGLFLQRSIAKSGPSQFIVQRLRTVLWPYIFSAASAMLDAVIRAEAASRASEGAGTGNLVHTILLAAITGEASWFLPTLFLCLLLALAVNRLPVAARAVVALALSLFWPEHAGGLIVTRVAEYFVYVAVGEWVGRRIERIESFPRWVCLLGSMAVFVLVAGLNLSAASPTRVMVLFLGFGGIAGLFLLANGLRSTLFEVASAWCGIASLGIFILHPFFQGAMRIVLARVTSSHAVFPNVFVPTLVAVLGSGLCWHYRERLRIGFLFEFPWGAPRRGIVHEKAITDQSITTHARSNRPETEPDRLPNRSLERIPRSTDL